MRGSPRLGPGWGGGHGRFPNLARFAFAVPEQYKNIVVQIVQTPAQYIIDQDGANLVAGAVQPAVHQYHDRMRIHHQPQGAHPKRTGFIQIIKCLRLSIKHPVGGF